MFEKMTKERLTNDENQNSNPSSLSSESVPACLAPKRNKSETGSIDILNSGWTGGTCAGGDGGGGGGGEEAILSMREFFEAGGRSYETYLKVCKDRRDKIVSITADDSVLTPDTSPLASVRRKTYTDNIPPPLPPPTPNSSAKTQAIGTEHSPVSNPATPTVMTPMLGSFSTKEKSMTMTSPGASRAALNCAAFTNTSGKSPEAVAASAMLLTSEIIDKVIEVGLKTSLSELPRFSSPCRALQKDSFAAGPSKTSTAPRPVSSPFLKLASSSSSGTSTFCELSPSRNSSSSTRQGSTVAVFSFGEEDQRRPSSSSSSSSSSAPEKRKPSCDDLPCAVDLSCKRQKSVEANEAGNQLKYESVTPPGDSFVDSILEWERIGTRINRFDLAPKVTYTQSATIFSDVTQWSVDQVVRYVANVPGCRDYAEMFRHEEIDGACLIRITERHLLDVIKMKLGPAIRLLQAIGSLCMNAWTSSEALPQQNRHKRIHYS